MAKQRAREGHGHQQAQTTPHPRGPELTVEEVIARYHGEWILLLVIRFDE